MLAKHTKSFNLVDCALSRSGPHSAALLRCKGDAGEALELPDKLLEIQIGMLMSELNSSGNVLPQKTAPGFLHLQKALSDRSLTVIEFKHAGRVSLHWAMSAIQRRISPSRQRPRTNVGPIVTMYLLESLLSQRWAAEKVPASNTKTTLADRIGHGNVTIARLFRLAQRQRAPAGRCRSDRCFLRYRRS